jgi:hypothetical protein
MESHVRLKSKTTSSESYKYGDPRFDIKITLWNLKQDLFRFYE